MPNSTEDPHGAALAELETDYPGWLTWTGVNGQVYARRTKTSPPCIVSAATAAELRLLVAAEEARRAL